MAELSGSNRRLRPLPPGAVELHHGADRDRRELTRSYLLSLRSRQLLQNHLIEAARMQVNEPPFDLHGGWESPSSQVRGAFLGHWMSAAALFWATTGDTRLKGALDHVVAELGLCQQANGGEWVASIPEKYLCWIKGGRAIWAPMYVAHKPLLGLHDAHVLAGNDQALDVIVNAARWFTRFTDDMTCAELDDLLDWETGGIQELWADLYGITGADEHLELVRRFDRRRLIDRLLAGDDPLTNQHANQTVPEILGAARAYEVTGDARWREAVEAYWRCAVTDRGSFATGGQTFGEYWTPPHEFAARLGPSNQEHCVVYNMMRLAERLLIWTGEACYADYLERNRVNGIYAQQNRRTGMVAYYLPLHAGARKNWATPTDTFWCCVGTQVQAGSRIGQYAYYAAAEGLTIADYLPSTARWNHHGTSIEVAVHTNDDTPPPGRANFEHGLPAHRPSHRTIDVEVRAEAPVDFDLTVRLPWWMAAAPQLSVDGEDAAIANEPGTFQSIRREWTKNRLRLRLPTKLVTVPLPDQPSTVAFMDGPHVLGGLVGERRTLHGDITDPSTLLEPTSELELGRWHTRYSTRGQGIDFPLVPLNEITDETYTVYFPVQSAR